MTDKNFVLTPPAAKRLVLTENFDILPTNNYNKTKPMEIITASQRPAGLICQLLEIWEQSVKATHSFLTSTDIAEIKKYVPQALANVEHLILAREKTPLGFMGIEKQRLEMLFLAPQGRGKGFGRMLLEYGFAHYGINEVTVNEQNPAATGFYEHMGFRTYKRTENDEQGNPWPLLYMRRPLAN